MGTVEPTQEPQPAATASALPVPVSSPAFPPVPAASAPPASPPAAAPVLPGMPPPGYYLPPGAIPYPPMPQGYPGYPAYAPYPGGYPAAPGPSPADIAVQAANQKLLISGIIAAVLVVHLPWLVYLVAVYGCGGSFIDLCFGTAEAEIDALSDTPLLFARVAFFMLRVQSVLAVDWARYSELMQLSTGLGSFALTKIAAARGTIATSNFRRYALAITCAVAFLILFVAEFHLTGSATYPALGDETPLGYIDLELPADFTGAAAAKASLLQYLQILRLADALIFGAALAMPKAPKGP